MGQAYLALEHRHGKASSPKKLRSPQHRRRKKKKSPMKDLQMPAVPDQLVKDESGKYGRFTTDVRGRLLRMRERETRATEPDTLGATRAFERKLGSRTGTPSEFSKKSGVSST